MSNAYRKDGSIVIHKGTAVGPSTPLAMPYGMRLDELDEEPGADEQKYQEYLKAHTPHVRTEQKIGRNDPCPCRSGLKFKKCHGG